MSLIKSRLGLNKSQSPSRNGYQRFAFPVYSQDNMNNYCGRACVLTLRKDDSGSIKTNIYNCRGLNSKQKSYKDCSSPEVRSKSVDERNNLFKRLASKMKTSNYPKQESKQQILQQYYQQNSNKQNIHANNFLTSKRPISNTNKVIKQSSSSKKDRYLIKQNEQNISSINKVKFNRIGAKKNKNINQECDFVRTSESQIGLKYEKDQSCLDMRPNI